MGSKLIAGLLAIIIAGAAVGGYFIIANQDPGDDPPSDDDGVFNYVSLGASNTNGYGMRGYISEEDIIKILDGEISREEVNVYGYQKSPEGAYPDLIRDYYVNIHGTTKVTLDQLAISSMRVEELRVLLDDTYDGDSYTTWRFTGSDGWFTIADEGGVDALRATYANKIRNADLVTVDIGWNNFGVYVSNQLMEYMSTGNFLWTVDLADIFDTPEEIAAANDAKDIIRTYIENNVGEGDLANAITDIFSYSILGYIHNFDIVMKKIIGLNPDADIVVIGIQNLLHGAVIELNGTPFPIGDVFGNFVDMANYYVSACSPYQTEFKYVKAGTNGHVNIFLDAIKGYDGNVESLDQNIKDCFDYYDDDFNIQPMIDAKAAELLYEEYGVFLKLLGYEDGKQAVKDGKAGKLEGTFLGISVQEEFDKVYWPALYAAYDTLATLMSAVAELESVDADGLIGNTISISELEDALADNLTNELIDNALAAANGEDYVVDIDAVLTDENTKLLASMYVRFFIGNSFFAHPDDIGHGQIKDAVIQVLGQPGTEVDQPLDENLMESVQDITELLS